MPTSWTPQIFGIYDVKRLAGHRQRDFQSPAPIASMPIAAGGAGVAVGAEQGFAGFAETLLVDRMADAVPGRLNQTPKRRQALYKKQMVVGDF